MGRRGLEASRWGQGKVASFVKMMMNLRVPLNVAEYEVLNKKPSPWN
jgi:hypothetical protein